VGILYFHVYQILVLLLRNICCQAPVAHNCNASYSRGRDQEDGSSKPTQANSLRDLISKNPVTKIGLVDGSGESPEFKPQYQKKGKKYMLT
jgi:hypothetical protein